MEPQNGTAAPLGLRLFGGFTAHRNNAPVEGLRAREADRLLAFLILAGRPVQSRAAASTFWPMSRSLDSLRQSIRQVRKALGPDGAERVRFSEGALFFHAEGIEVDVLQFDRLAAQDDLEAMRQAVTLYTGPLLEGWEDEWVVKERERRQERCASAEFRLSETALKAGNFRLATEHLRRSVELRPQNERAWRDLISAQSLSGERVAAMETYERYRAYLNRRGRHLQPPAEITALYASLREGAARSETAAVSPLSPVDAARESIGGAVPLDSLFYLARPADDLFCPAVAGGDSLVLVKGPRQSGKSSLLARGLQQARRAGAVTVAVDFEALPPQDIQSLDALCLRLAAHLSAQLDIETAVVPKDVWKPVLGPGTNLERFLMRHVLSEIDAPLVWAMDGVDRLFTRPFGGEFFSLLRTWHEKRALEPQRPWRRLTIALACATEAHLFIRDLNKSPFNVGTRVELTDFSREQVADLNRRYGSPLTSEGEMAAFYGLVAGHPYLVRRGLHEMAAALAPHRRLSLDELVRCGADEDGPFGDHLRRLAQRLEDDPELLAAALDALQGKACPPDFFFRLRSAGVLMGEVDAIQPRCGLYAAYLTRRFR